LDLAEAQLGEHHRSRRAAFEGVLSKPFDREVLVNTVDGVVEESVRSALSISM
jgi:hypothetical protein